MATNGAQNIPTASSGKVLQGAGVGTAPAFSTATYPSTAGSTGTILRADGTNWVATTNTYPNTATTGDILYASGTSVIGNLADVAVGQVLTSGGVGAVPAYSAAPTVTSITFGAGTALSTYAEGTWTPALTVGGSTTGITYSAQTGEYTKIGNVVFLRFNMTLSNKGSNSGNLQITGLPFTVNTTQDCSFPVALWQKVTLDASYTMVMFNCAQNGTAINPNEQGSGQAGALLTAAMLVNTSHFQGTGFYFTS